MCRFESVKPAHERLQSTIESIKPRVYARTEGIRSLVEAGKVDRSLFGEKDLAEISAEEIFPGERLVVCRKPRKSPPETPKITD